MTSAPTFTLHTGNKIPSIALGTWESFNDVVANAVFSAIKDGYRHIDTAAVYENEEGVGAGINKAISELGIKREELFITTKLWLTEFHHAAKALDTSLEKLFPGDKNAYVDLYLIHWPYPITANGDLDNTTDYKKAWAQLEELPTSKVKDIGLSNFTIEQIKDLLAVAKKTPVVNQVELHINLPQPELIEFLLSGKYGSPAHDGKVILPAAYSPMGRGNLSDPVIAKIAEAHKTGPANIVLSWGISRHTVVLPKSASPERIASNLAFIELTEQEKKTIDEHALKSPSQRHFKSPSQCDLKVY